VFEVVGCVPSCCVMLRVLFAKWNYLILSEKFNRLLQYNIVRIRWAGHVARMDQMRNKYSNLIGTSEKNRSLKSSGLSCEV
jgi:hypothetical protein